MKSRAYYQRSIWKYEQRRKVLKGVYGRTSEYGKRVKHITKKISTWKREIRRIDERVKKIPEIYKAVKDFFGIDIRVKGTTKKYSIAISCYYKYGMENGISGADLARYIGRVGLKQPSFQRLKFTRSFKTNQSNKQIYHNFVNLQIS